MTTITEKPELAEYRKQDAIIASMASEYLPLKINGLTDKAGFAKVHEARMVVKNFRVTIEKTRKELKADALKYGQTVDAEARRLAELIAPIETHLEAEENAITAEKERIKQAAETAKRELVQKRVDALAAYGATVNAVWIADATEPMYEEYLAKAKAGFEAKQEAARLAEETRQAELAAQRAESERLAAERARLEEIAKQQKAEADRLLAEQKRIADEAESQRRAAELEKAKREAAERARIEIEARLNREAAARQERERLAEQERKAEENRAIAAREKMERERPYREKMVSFANQIRSLEVPDGPWSDEARAILLGAASEIETLVAELQPA